MILNEGKLNTKFKVCNTIRDWLLNDPVIEALVGKNIFPVVAPENTKGPFIIYQRDSYSLQKTKMQIFEQDCTVFITCVSSDYDEAVEIAEAVFQSLQGIHVYKDPNTQVVINQIDLQDSTESYSHDFYLQTLQFNIK